MANFHSSNANRVKGNDIDPDADGSVVEADHAASADHATSADSATDADTVDGKHAGDIGGNGPVPTKSAARYNTTAAVSDGNIYHKDTSSYNWLQTNCTLTVNCDGVAYMKGEAKKRSNQNASSFNGAMIKDPNSGKVLMKESDDKSTSWETCTGTADVTDLSGDVTFYLYIRNDKGDWVEGTDAKIYKNLTTADV